jgi:hypothetical protein
MIDDGLVSGLDQSPGPGNPGANLRGTRLRHPVSVDNLPASRLNS